MCQCETIANRVEHIKVVIKLSMPEEEQKIVTLSLLIRIDCNKVRVRIKKTLIDISTMRYGRDKVMKTYFTSEWKSSNNGIVTRVKLKSRTTILNKLRYGMHMYYSFHTRKCCLCLALIWLLYLQACRYNGFIWKNGLYLRISLS